MHCLSLEVSVVLIASLANFLSDILVEEPYLKKFPYGQAVNDAKDDAFRVVRTK